MEPSPSPTAPEQHQTPAETTSRYLGTKTSPPVYRPLKPRQKEVVTKQRKTLTKWDADARDYAAYTSTFVG
ncbi:uncharacterized protein ACHE_80713A [Aspergillus chevalieri]|uniref:Uncharacterized protein n=1 Tax=Aspergillus chevalieri TaxID=182096 RepID=A0A7R7VYU9_ASPCH|nr:uncharacterized protein ACHE_80713A [Aspergillus chevalieri]BCR92813.1 hypothetical protein ACHE_80713A [Aspergillus chevalieri]